MHNASHDPGTQAEAAPAVKAREHLLVLHAQRAQDLAQGIAPTDERIAGLDAEIDHATAAFTGIAVTEIACLRAALSGALRG
jgi:hypothetical protein